MIAFWSQSLRYVPREPAAPDGVVLRDPDGRGPNLNLSLSGEGPLEAYRLHLDLYSKTPAAEVERLVRLGATVRRGVQPGQDFVTLADPDGNLFDVIDANWTADPSTWSFGQQG